MSAATKYIQTVVSKDVHIKLYNLAMKKEVALHNLLREIIEEWVKNNLNKEVTNNGEEKIEQGT